jgi:methylmalonyl-CoA carboxyltransferase 5S subunit
MESHLKEMDALDRRDEVMAEIPKVRKDAGYVPLVTPSSQIVGTQAVMNVLMGSYKVMTNEFSDLMLGYYGETLGEKNPEVVKLAAERTGKQPITCRPADLQPPEWDKLREEALALKGNNGSDEDVLTYAMFPQVAPKFFEHRHDGPTNVSQDKPAACQAAAAPHRPPRRPAMFLTLPVDENNRFRVTVERKIDNTLSMLKIQNPFIRLFIG